MRQLSTQLGINSKINLFNSLGNLILSGAVGSTIVASGGLKIKDPNNGINYSINASDSHLILSSSAGSIVCVSGTLNITDVSGNVAFTQDASREGSHVVAKNSYLILSSTVGSIVALSSSLLFPIESLPSKGHICANGVDLILSSTTSRVTLSSSLSIRGPSSLNFSINSKDGDLILSSSVNSRIYISGNLVTNGFRIGYTSLTSQTTLTNNDCFVEANATAGSFGIVLPTAIGFVGKIFHIKKTDATANAVVVSGTAAETIDGDANVPILNQYTCLSFISNNANWLIM
jgi:hypothetical protein